MGINASLLADEASSSTVVQVGSLVDGAIINSSMPNQGGISIAGSAFNPSQISPNKNSPIYQSSSHIGIKQKGMSQISSSQISPRQIGSSQNGMSQISTPQIGISEIRESQSTHHQTSTKEISPSQVASTQFNSEQVSTSQVDSSQVQNFLVSPIPSTQFDPFVVTSGVQIDSSKITLSNSVPSQQFIRSDFPSHNAKPQIINALNNSATKIWSDLLKSENQLNIDFQITDLPSGQLAEATITGFEDSGKPNAGTILIDSDANGIGWFIDETPLDNSEFTSNTANYFLAEPNSEASGKYDLLTTVLHELSHLYGFIDGYQGYSDRLVAGERLKVKGKGEQSNTLNPSPLTFNQGEVVFDGEHLDKQAHPDDLLNTHLAPGMRKLPSELDVEILKAILAEGARGARGAGEAVLKGTASHRGENPTALLTSDPLLGINNGDFSITDTTADTFAWDTRGASSVEKAQAVLTEDSPFQSNFTQTFTVPEAAKTIQFKLVETELGASELAPPDAFEVALLDADTQESLTTETGLTETDSLLNIQPDGTAHFSDQVRIGGATSGDIINLDKSRTVTIDISDLTPGTEATLYFDLLGFGEVDSRVVIDDVRLSDQNLLPPVAQSDRATTSQGKPVIINILENDSDDDGAIAPESVQIATEPSNGTVQVNQDGTVTYTPSDRLTGSDTFAYLVADNDGQQSESATVTVNVANAAPKITQIQIPDTITEGDEVELEAIAIPGSPNFFPRQDGTAVRPLPFDRNYNPKLAGNTIARAIAF